MYWKFATLAIFAIFCLWTWYESKAMKRREEAKEEAYWKRELEANNTRRKPIDHLDYVHIPENLPYDIHPDNAEIASCIKVINDLKDATILNLTGYSNTDLKLKYGAPNITVLSTSDQNYTTLVTTLQKWADELIKLGFDNEAISIMEFMVSTGVDIGKTYRLLAKHYLADGAREKYDALVETAEGIRSLNKNSIVTSLKEMG